MPHASTALPPKIRKAMLRSGESPASLNRRLLAHGDPLTGEIYAGVGLADFPAPFSRFAVDLNRGREEDGPDGVIRPWDFDKRPFYAPGEEPDAAERERRLAAYWDPYHRALAERLARGDARMLWDGHSLSGTGPALGPDQGRRRPLLCLGNHGDAEGNPLPDRPPTFSPAAMRGLRDAAKISLAVAFPDWPDDDLCRLNDPFESGYLNYHYSHPDRDPPIPAILCEINRDSYWNEITQTPLEDGYWRWETVLHPLMAAAADLASL